MKKRKGSITSKWFFNTISIIVLIFAVIEIVLAFGVKDYYYQYTKDFMTSQMNVIMNSLSKVSQNSDVNYSDRIKTIVEEYENKDKFEIMVIDINGDIKITSSGFMPTDEDIINEFKNGIESEKAIKFAEIEMIKNEKVMTLTFLIPPLATTEFFSIKIMTSLDEVNFRIFQFLLVVTLIFVVVLIAISISGIYFIRSIITSLNEIRIKANDFAKGDFSQRIEGKENNEIGELCDAINTMAEDLSKAESIKNEFISSVSHELRTPLTAIKGWSETLEEIDDQEIFKKGMKVISSETQRLSQMVEELLDFSRMENGNLLLVKVKMDLLAELTEAVLMYQAKADSEKKYVRYTEPDVLPCIYGDKNRIKQVFINVIDNALKYTDEGDSIDINAFEESGYIIVVISDTGIGINSQDLQKVKTKFYKGNHLRRGSGIGLAVVDEIVTMHGGTITIESEENVGTKISIAFPILPKNK